MIRGVLRQLEDLVQVSKEKGASKPLNVDEGLLEWEVEADQTRSLLSQLRCITGTGRDVHGKDGILALCGELLSSLSPSSESTYVYRGESDNQSRDVLGAEAVGIIRLLVDVWLSNLDQLDAVLRLVLTHVEKFAHPESGGVDTAQALLRHLESMNRVPLTVPMDEGSNSSLAPADNLKKLVATVGSEVFAADSAGAQT